jgi:cellulase
MAKCPASCADFDGSGAVWFKIDEAGLLSGTINKGEWGNGIILKTLKWTTTIPASLTPGNYIIRVRTYIYDRFLYISTVNH